MGGSCLRPGGLGLGFRVWGTAFRVHGSGFTVQGAAFRIGIGVQGSESRVEG